MTSVLVLGASNSGKTVLGAQLYGRARFTRAALILREQASDIQVLEHAFRSLQRGMLPSRTAEATFGTIDLPLLSRDTDEPVNLVWPDYGGEQFNHILEQRQLTPEWEARVQSAQGVLLLIRPAVTFVPPDVLSRPGVREAEGSGYASDIPPPDEQLAMDSAYVELLQLLAFVKGLNRTQRFQWPLTIALTCWDEVASKGLGPREQLQQRLPLFWHYLQGAWQSSVLRIVGVSALERPLQNDAGTPLNALQPDERLYPDDASKEDRARAMRAASDPRFREATPQTQGYLSTAVGHQDADLTLLIEPLLTAESHAT